MSRIWTALPAPATPWRSAVPEGVSWWRLLLTPNADRHKLVIHSFAQLGDDHPATLGCWEWFDGLHAQLVYGTDVYDVRVAEREHAMYLDVLAAPDVIPHEPLKNRWTSLTDAGDVEPRRYPFPGTGMPLASSPVVSYPYEPHMSGSALPDLKESGVAERMDVSRYL